MYTVKLTTGETLTCRDVWQDFNEFHLTVADKDGDYDLYCCIDEVESVTPEEEESTEIKETQQDETFLKWAYVGDNKETVVMVMDSKTFECLRQTLDEHKKLKKYIDEYESDMVNGFPCPNWRINNG